MGDQSIQKCRGQIFLGGPKGPYIEKGFPEGVKESENLAADIFG